MQTFLLYLYCEIKYPYPNPTVVNDAYRGISQVAGFPLAKVFPFVKILNYTYNTQLGQQRQNIHQQDQVTSTPDIYFAHTPSARHLLLWVWCITSWDYIWRYVFPIGWKKVSWHQRGYAVMFLTCRYWNFASYVLFWLKVIIHFRLISSLYGRTLMDIK